MYINYKKLLVLFIAGSSALGGLYWGYSHSPISTGLSQAVSRGEAGRIGGSLLSLGGDARSIAERDARRSRSPAFVPGSAQDVQLKEFVARLVSDPQNAAAETRLKEFFPENTPVNRWIRASMILGTASMDGEITPEYMESIGKVYGQVLDGEESAIASLQAGLQSLPVEEGAFRQQAFRMLSDIGLKNRDLREPVKNALLAEASRVGSRPDGALAFVSLLRINPTKEWYQEVSRTFSKMHPGAELSDFVSLNVANL